MDFQQILDAATDWLDDNWLKFLTGLLIAAFGWVVGRTKARRNWKKKEFLDRINFSLTSIRNGKMEIRTLMENKCADVFLNSTAMDAVTAASTLTRPEDPTLPLPPDEYWYFLNAVLNEVSEKYSIGVVRREMGHSTITRKYVIALTCECAGAVRTRKIRAMVTDLKTLTHLPKEMPTLESPSHKTRWQTLNQLAHLYVTNPERFLTMEITL